MPPLPEPSPASAGPSPEILVVIAAAISTVLGSHARVVSVRLAPEYPTSVGISMQLWSLEGRRQIYASHRIR